MRVVLLLDISLQVEKIPRLDQLGDKVRLLGSDTLDLKRYLCNLSFIITLLLLLRRHLLLDEVEVCPFRRASSDIDWPNVERGLRSIQLVQAICSRSFEVSLHLLTLCKLLLVFAEDGIVLPIHQVGCRLQLPQFSVPLPEFNDNCILAVLQRLCLTGFLSEASPEGSDAHFDTATLFLCFGEERLLCKLLDSLLQGLSLFIDLIELSLEYLDILLGVSELIAVGF